MTFVTRLLRLGRTSQSAVARFLQSLATAANAPLGSTISKRFYWSLRRPQDDINQSASPQRGRSEVSGARCAERASEVGARGRTNKVAGVLITAIPFGSAARRCSWENGIFCYQMTVLIEMLFAETLLCEESRKCFSVAGNIKRKIREIAWS